MKQKRTVVRLGRKAAVSFISILALLTARHEADAEPANTTPDYLSATVHNLSERLNLDAHVVVRVDATNDKMAAAEPMSDGSGYLISFDRSFLESLNIDEEAGAIAHELGHIWIFLHHPYLQTEALANEIAMRIVDRDTLKRIYVKLWARTGIAGDAQELLGPEPVDISVKRGN
jgi:hypothetical protein